MLLEKAYSAYRFMMKSRPIYARTFCTAQGFYQQTAPILRPSLIYHDSTGLPISAGISYSAVADQWIGLIDRRPNPPEGSQVFRKPATFVYAGWSPLPGDNGSDQERLSTLVEDKEHGIGYLDSTLLASRQGVYAINKPTLVHPQGDRQRVILDFGNVPVRLSSTIARWVQILNSSS